MRQSQLGIANFRERGNQQLAGGSVWRAHRPRRRYFAVCALFTLGLTFLLRASAVATINIRDYGAKGDGVTDDSAAIIAAIKAARGVFHTSPINNCQNIFFPHGTYLVRPGTLHLVYGLSGCGIFGEGAYASAIRLTKGSGWALLQDEGQDGQLQNFFIRDLEFLGPGSSSSLDWFYLKGIGGTGGLLVENVTVHGFREGLRIEGNAAADTASFIKLTMTDINVAFHLNNQQSVPNELISPSICTNKDVFFFDKYAAAGWHVVGGYLCGLGAGSIFHYGSAFNGGYDNQNLIVTGTHFELLTSAAELILDDAPQSTKEFACYGCNSDTVIPNDNRNTVTLRTGARFLWSGGMFGGLVTLDMDLGVPTPTPHSEPPIFTLNDADWDTGDVPPFNAIKENVCTTASRCISIPAGKRDQPGISFHLVRALGYGVLSDPPLAGRTGVRLWWRVRKRQNSGRSGHLW
jgi:Pectate lyase superfamily protein